MNNTAMRKWIEDVSSKYGMGAGLAGAAALVKPFFPLSAKYSRLPSPDEWDKGLALCKLKDDGGVRDALKVLWHLRVDQYDKRLAQLPKIRSSAITLKKSNQVKENSLGAERMVDELLGVMPKVAKKEQERKRQFEANGACLMDVQFIVVDWNGKVFEHSEGHASFESPGVPNVVTGGKLTGTGLSLNDIRLRSSGSVSLEVYPPGDADRIAGAASYSFKRGDSIIKFKAEQHRKEPQRMRAKTIDEATRLAREKFNLKGSAGIDFIIKVGGGGDKESEHTTGNRKGLEQEREWLVYEPSPTFKKFTQI